MVSYNPWKNGKHCVTNYMNLGLFKYKYVAAVHLFKLRMFLKWFFLKNYEDIHIENQKEN